MHCSFLCKGYIVWAYFKAPLEKCTHCFLHIHTDYMGVYAYLVYWMHQQNWDLPWCGVYACCLYMATPVYKCHTFYCMTIKNNNYSLSDTGNILAFLRQGISKTSVSVDKCAVCHGACDLWFTYHRGGSS